MAVSAISIVKYFDVFKYVCLGKIASFVDTFSDSFFFPAIKERFGNRVIPTVSAAAHAGFQIEWRPSYLMPTVGACSDARINIPGID